VPDRSPSRAPQFHHKKNFRKTLPGREREPAQLKRCAGKGTAKKKKPGGIEDNDPSVLYRGGEKKEHHPKGVTCFNLENDSEKNKGRLSLGVHIKKYDKKKAAEEAEKWTTSFSSLATNERES